MALLILESLGSTELLFILIMALVFFGPRKLPQISRSLGKNLAEFRRASEDFKTTWHREVNLEEFNILDDNDDGSMRREAQSQPDNEAGQQASPLLSSEPVTPDRVIARQPATPDHVVDQADLHPNNSNAPSVTDQVDSSGKRDWL